MPRNALLPLIVCAALAGCDTSDPEGGPSEKTRASWVLTLNVQGTEVKLPLERMDVLLVEDDKYPEIFEITGPGVALVGEFPLDIHVGYSQKWEKLFNKTVKILPSGGDPREPKDSHITIPGKSTLKVLEGHFVAKKKTGKREDDTTLWGEVKLLVTDEKGNGFTVEGTFAVHAASFG